MIGVIHGRFQPFHLDHLKYALAAKEKCDYLLIGITNPDPFLTADDQVDLHRSLQSANPFTYYERLVIVRESLLEAGLNYTSFDIVPLPINIPELIKFYIPSDAIHFLTIYDDWGKRKYELLNSLGLNVEVLWTKSLHEKGITASDVRSKIIHGLPWEYLCPPAAVGIIKSMGLDKRIKES